MTAAVPATVTYLRSRQGEQQQEHQPTRVQADQAWVDAYVKTAPDAVLECRTRGHRFPFVRTRTEFTGYDEASDTLTVEETCLCCEMAHRVEYWSTVRRGRHTRYERVDVRTYYDQDYLLDPGHGYMTRRQVGDALMTQSMASMSPAAVLKAAKARAKP